jgi:hypothetical protein
MQACQVDDLEKMQSSVSVMVRVISREAVILLERCIMDTLRVSSDINVFMCVRITWKATEKNGKL